ncbi:hypothetical protein ABE132_09815 [Peribacillus simplex]|uniref:hypothetical protein n=1 Tax=Peribacillus simplex TaxID=1478 RepID=UPI003D281BD3
MGTLISSSGNLQVNSLSLSLSTYWGWFQPAPWLRLGYPSCFFTVILNGLKKFATLLPNNWLAETPETLASRRLGRQSAERERISEINSNVFKKKKLQAGSSRTLVKTRLSFMLFYSNP